MNKFLAVSLAALIVTGSAAAPAFAQTFDGAYLGLAGGYSQVSTDAELTDGYVDIGGDGLTGGAFGGYGVTFDSVYVGAEATADLSDTESYYSELDFSSELRRKASLAVSARLGFTPAENVLLFASAGLSRSNFEQTQVDAGDEASAEVWSNGYRFGAGIDTIVSENVFARVSYDVDFVDDDNFNGDYRTGTGKVGVGFRF